MLGNSMKFKSCFILIVLILFGSTILHASFKRAMVVWNTNDLLNDTTERNIFLNQCIADSTTDIYVYAYDLLSGTNRTKMHEFVSKFSCFHMRIWAMDGYRGYFADWNGRSEYIQFIQSVIQYNDSSTTDQRLYGIVGDNEPQDGQGEPNPTFHNDIPSSALDSVGGGLWMSTEVLDREFLMQDWINMTQEAYDSCHAHNLKYGQLMVSWLDDYYGEAIFCTYNGQYKRVLAHLMNYLDNYTLMVYSTKPSKVWSLASGELTYSDSLSPGNRPEIWLTCETHCNVGPKLSYCDTLLKSYKDSVFQDINVVESLASSHSAYVGYVIHDWIGWKYLKPVSTNSAYKPCTIVNTSEVAEEFLQVEAYPNPARKEITLRHLKNPTTIEIMNNMGLVLRKEICRKSTETLSLNYSSGLYFIRMKSGTHTKVLKLEVE